MKQKANEKKEEKIVEEKVIRKIEKEKQERKEKAKMVEDKIIQRVYYIILVVIGVLGYFILLNLAYQNFEISKMNSITEIVAILFFIFGLTSLEIAYRKESGKKMINAIEALVLAGHALSIFYITTRFKFDFQIYILASSYFVSLYFLGKAVFIYTKGKRDYLNSLSDISELVKKEEPMIKEATKKEKKVEEKKEEKKSINQDKKKATTKSATKKATATKELETKQATKKENTTKPKEAEKKKTKTATKEAENQKSKTTKKEKQIIKTIKEETTEETPKKRRKKKEVVEND